MIRNWIDKILFEWQTARSAHSLQRQKDELRANLAQRRRLLPPEVVAQCSQEVVQAVQASEAYERAQTVLMYYPLHNEIDLRGLLDDASKTFLLPVTHHRSLEIRPYASQSDLQKGKFGIMEPQTPTYTGKVDLIIVPGVAFDHHLHRMGRGGGYYDRFLRKYRHTPKIGVCYAFQYLESIPRDRHDQNVTQIFHSTTR